MKRPSYIIKPKDGDIVVDNSIMKEVLKCSTSAVLQYKLGLQAKQQGAALLQGQAGHVSMATWFETGDAHLALKAYRGEFRRIVQPVLDQLPKEDKDRQRLAFDRTRAILRAWFDSRPLAKFPLVVDPAEVEHPVSAPLMTLKDGRRVVFVALFDALAKRRTGGRYSMDHKFRGFITDWWKEKQKDSAQFTGQSWLGRMWDMELAGVYVNAIEVPNVKTGKQKCPVHGVPYYVCDWKHARHELIPLARSRTEIEFWLRTLAVHVPRWVKLADRVEELGQIHSVPMEGRFNEGCTFCSFKKWCNAKRPTNSVADWFLEYRWDPLAERRPDKKLSA